MSGVIVRECSVADVFDDPAWPALLTQYEPECANPLLGGVSPDRRGYEALEALGAGQCFRALAHGKLCGFAFLLIGTLPHYGRRFATVESLFVAQAARTTGAGLELMRAFEARASAAGCGAILYSAGVDSRLAGLLELLHREYRLTNYVYTKRLA